MLLRYDELSQIQARAEAASKNWTEKTLTEDGLTRVGPISAINGSVTITQLNLDFVLSARADVLRLLEHVKVVHRALSWLALTGEGLCLVLGSEKSSLDLLEEAVEAAQASGDDEPISVII